MSCQSCAGSSVSACSRTMPALDSTMSSGQVSDAGVDGLLPVGGAKRLGHALSAGEHWRPLLRESALTLPVVLGPETGLYHRLDRGRILSRAAVRPRGSPALAAATVSGALAAMVAASSVTSIAQLRRRHHAVDQPDLQASAAEIRRAENRISEVQAGPTSPVSAVTPPTGRSRGRGEPPECRTGCRRRDADVGLQRGEQAAAHAEAADHGDDRLAEATPALASAACSRSIRGAGAAGDVRCSPNSEMSAPDTNALSPAPVTTMTRTSGSDCRAARRPGSAARISVTGRCAWPGC